MLFIVLAQGLPAIILVGAGLLLSAPGAAQMKQPSIDLGTASLNLGMTRANVSAALKQAGYFIAGEAPEGRETKIAITQKDPSKEQVWVWLDNDGELYFRDGTLVRVVKKIVFEEDRTDRDLAFSLYGLVKSLQKDGGNSPCAIGSTNDEDSTGHIQIRTINVNCYRGAGIYRTIYLKWTTADSLKSQYPVSLFEELRKAAPPNGLR